MIVGLFATLALGWCCMTKVRACLEVRGDPRGLFATKDLYEGDVLCSVLVRDSIHLGTIATAAESSLVLLREKYRKTRKRFDAYIETLPERVLNVYTCSEEEREQIPGIDLKTQAERKVNWTRSVFRDLARPALFGGREIDEKEFMWATAIITSRALSIEAPNGNVGMYLIPTIDMANHDEHSKHRVILAPGGEEFRLVCGQPVKQGEEVRISYGSLAMDEAALNYGFIPDTAKGRLCAADEYGWTPEAQPPFQPTQPKGFSMANELKRLQLKLGDLKDEEIHLQPPEHASTASLLFRSLRKERITALEKKINVLRQELQQAEL